MGATKATLIVVGTVTGMGAVLAYSPPHHTLNLGGGGMGSGSLGGGPTHTSSAPQASSTPSPASTPASPSTPSAASTPAVAASIPSKNSTAPAKPKATKRATPSKKPAKPTQKLVNGTFTGAAANTAYGPVQVQIDVKDSKIVAARALQLPAGTSRDQEINAQAIPILIQETVSASSSDIQGVSGASYTSQGWYDSLVNAISNAGL